MNDVHKRLTRCFLAAFPQMAESDVPAASAESVVEWDSLSTVTLLSLVQDEFGLRIPPQAFDRLLSYRGILEYLDQRAVAGN